VLYDDLASSELERQRFCRAQGHGFLGICSFVSLADEQVQSIASRQITAPSWLVFPDNAQLWHSKRTLEYVAGRKAAALAMAHLGHASHPVEANLDRSPCWPDGIKASISHNNKLAICAMLDGFNRDLNGIGVDIECSQSVADNIMNPSIIVNNRERYRLIQAPFGFEKALALAFSVKESLFKAVYPNCRKYFDFLDVQIDTIDIVEYDTALPVIDATKSILGSCVESKGKVGIRLLNGLNPSLPKGTLFVAEFEFTKDDVITRLVY